MPTADIAGRDPSVQGLVSGVSRAVVATPLPETQVDRSPVTLAEPHGPEGGEAGTTGSIFRIIGRVFIENKLAVVGVVILVLVFLFCFAGPFIYHTDQLSIILRPISGPGSCGGGRVNIGPACPLGVDDQGFDVLGRLMVAGQSDLEVGLAAAFVATFIGVVWGAVAGFIGGVVDSVMMRIVDVLLSIPILLLLIVIATMFSPGKDQLILIIGGLAWLTPARLVRGETLSLRTREYVQAVRVMGGRGHRIVLRHIIPNAVGTIVVNATFQVADAILTLAALSFLKLGLHYPQTDWGDMLTDGATYASEGYWWLIVPAGSFIVMTVVAFNFIGDALRDSLEVRLQRR
ncbi:MAG: ABC transporter permease [Acidimicrobiales bacterium]|jgi:peptide/nickel transport system permease protein